MEASRVLAPEARKAPEGWVVKTESFLQNGDVKEVNFTRFNKEKLIAFRLSGLGCVV